MPASQASALPGLKQSASFCFRVVENLKFRFPAVLSRWAFVSRVRLTPIFPAASLSAMQAPSPSAIARQAERARARTLSEWRRVDLRPVEIAARSAARTAGELMPQVLARLRLEQRVAESQIQAVWKKTIDPTITEHAQPAGLAKGTLFVNVDSNVWLSEIVRYRRHEILERIQLVVGKAMVQRISFRVA
jgi:predicted nucleic acid-binding Zn ribbon protein